MFLLQKCHFIGFIKLQKHNTVSNLVTRTLFGAIFVAVVIASIVCGSKYVFCGIFSVIMLVTLNEYYTLCNQLKQDGGAGAHVEPARWLCMAAAAALFVGAVSAGGNMALAFGLPLVVIIPIAELFRQKQLPFHNMAFGQAGLVYIAVPFVCMALTMEINPLLLLAFFVLIWAGDTGAYCVGRLAGRHKMFERVSPKKTWEGLAGGLLFAMLFAWLFNRFGHDIWQDAFPVLQPWQWLLFAAVVYAAGTLGDLVESIIKRYLGLKDSGRFLPGHGGALDRFDSALTAAPVAYALLCAFNMAA